MKLKHGEKQAVNRRARKNAIQALSVVLALGTTLLVAPPLDAQGRAGGLDRGAGGEVEASTGQGRGGSAGQRQVVRPEDDDTGERFNLPPNFDPSFRARNTPRSQRVNIDFRDSPLDDVVRFFSATMNLNFIVTDSLAANKKITIISPQPVTMDEAYRAFLSALEMNGLTIVPQGNFLKIIDSGAAISEPMMPFESGDTIPDEARMVTAIIPVENASIDEVEEVIRNFTSSSANIIKYHSSLIITENASNLRRLRALVQRLDQGEAASNVYVYRVRYADASEIQQQLQTIFGAGSGGAGAARQPQARQQTAAEQRRARARQARGDSTAPSESTADDLDVQITEIISDERTNQLIIISNERSFDRIREMIEILDVPTAVGGEIHVKFLEYASAEELSQTLSQLASGAGAQQRGGGGDREGAAQDGAAQILRGEVQITAHAPSNALVVVASPRAFVALENVINQLDRPQRQVYVEAVIMEISLDVNRELDIGLASGISQDLGFLIPDSAIDSGLIESTRGTGFGQSNFQGLEGLVGPGLGLGLLGPSVTLPGTGISLPAVALLLQATQRDNMVNVLSTPSILTMDNEEAEIVVGERVPIPRGIGSGAGGLGSLLGLGALTGAGGQAAGQQGLGGLGALGGLGGLGGLAGGLFTPVDYEDVGITLRILPQINESDYVRLEVDQEVSDVKAAGSDLGVVRTRRNATTKVLVRDQSTIVIGGLMRDVENETVSKVPFLGDIPVLGLLFRSTTVTTTKQNLVLMLTPYIIESEEDLQKIYDRKMEERRELARLFAQRDLNYMRSVNFQKKVGLLERMRQQISDANIGEAARQDALRQFEDDGPRYQILGGQRDRERRRRGWQERPGEQPVPAAPGETQEQQSPVEIQVGPGDAPQEGQEEQGDE